MANQSSRKVARDLKKTARNVRKIPDDSMRTVVLDIRDEAGKIGGAFAGRSMTADVKSRKRGYTRTAVIFGRPAGGWVVKTFGRDGVRPKRARALHFNGGFYTRVGPAGPTRRNWDDVFDYAQKVTPARFEQDIDTIIART